MAQFPVSTSNEHAIYAALELSKNSWLLAIQAPGRGNPSLHPIKGGDAEGLMAKLDAARDRVVKVTGRTPTITLCYEAGYDGFWLARFLEQRGIECLDGAGQLAGQPPGAAGEDRASMSRIFFIR